MARATVGSIRGKRCCCLRLPPWFREQDSTSTANYIDDQEVSAAFIARPLEWRVRAVEEVIVDSATSCSRRRSLQVAPLREFLQAPRRATHALVALNVAAMPRGPLLDFNVAGPDGDAWLLPRSEIAARQCLYLIKLAAEAGVDVGEGARLVLERILGFVGEWFSTHRDGSVEQFIEAGLGGALSDGTRLRWSLIEAKCREILRPRLDRFQRYSAAESPQLVMPGLLIDGDVNGEQEATDLLEEYKALITRMSELSDRETPNAAEDFLVSLADYANYYDLIVAMKVPLDEPFLVKITERRDIDRMLGVDLGTQELVVADAKTNHVTFKVSDPNVRISSFSARSSASEDFAYGLFQSREDAQNRAFYAHNPDRDYRIVLTFRLALLRRLQLVPYSVAALLALLTAALWIDTPSSLQGFAMVVGPAALAASVLLGREPSTLGSRLRTVSTAAVAGSLLALLVSATCLYAFDLLVSGTT